MLKITINDNGKTLTLYVADDAIADKNFPTEAKEHILKLIAERMFLKLDGNDVVYLAAIDLPNPEHPDKVIIQYNNQANQKDSYLRASVSMTPGENQTHTISIEDLAEENVSFSPPRDAEANQYRKVLLEKGVATADNVDHLVKCLSDDPAIYLTSIRDEVFADIPADFPNELRDGLNQFVDLGKDGIHSQAREINNERKYVQELIEASQKYSLAYYAVTAPLAANLYNAAKATYIDIMKKYGGNYAQLREQFKAFNILFDGIANINEDFSISSLEQAIENLRKLDVDTLQKKISTLVQNAYQQKDQTAFKTLESKLSSVNDNYAMTGTVIPWSYKFVFSDATKEIYASYQQANAEVDNIARGGLGKLVETIHIARRGILDRAVHIKDENKVAIAKHNAEIAKQQASLAKQQAKTDAAANKNAQGSFWQRNKGTLTSIGVGLLIGAGAAVAIVFLWPLAWPVLAIAGLAAGVGLAVVGVSAIVGRIIDSRRNKKAKDQYADASHAREERTSLVADTDSDFTNNATTAQLFAKQAKQGYTGNGTAKNEAADDEFSTPPLQRSGSLTSLFAPAENAEDREIQEMAAFESKLVWKIAEILHGEGSTQCNKLGAKYTNMGQNLDQYLIHVKQSYPATAHAVISAALTAVAKDHPKLNLALFKDSVLEKEFMKGKEESSPSSKRK